MKDDIKDAQVALIKEKNKNLYNFLELSQYIGNISNKYYLTYMAIRLLEMKRILKDTGSLYLHCDNTMGHYLKLLLDVIFSGNTFRNEIVWGYSTYIGKVKKWFPKKHDSIFWYTKSNAYPFKFMYSSNAEESINFQKWKK